jgi:hypothetical protein
MAGEARIAEEVRIAGEQIDKQESNGARKQ